MNAMKLLQYARLGQRPVEVLGHAKVIALERIENGVFHGPHETDVLEEFEVCTEILVENDTIGVDG